jgi:cytochrome b
VVRICHWTLVAAIALAWLTRHGALGVHEPAGYVALGIVGARIAWGFTGAGHARFSDFVRSPARTWAYAALVLQQREPRHVGHNPLGGWMILALLAVTALAAASGWLYATDRFWGVGWVAALHELLSDLLLALIALHIAGVLLTSRRQRENLIAAMLHGRKRD